MNCGKGLQQLQSMSSHNQKWWGVGEPGFHLSCWHLAVGWLPVHGERKELVLT